MPNYDLQGAIEARVANQEVDMLRIANTLVWEKPPDENPLYSVFEDAVLTGITAHNDTPTNSWLAQHFRKSPGPALEIVELGIFIPAGGAMIGQSSGKIGIQYNATFFDGTGSYTNDIPSLTQVIFSQTMVAGWNWIPFTTPLAWTDTFPHILGAYSIGTHYMFSSTFDTSVIASASGLFELDSSRPATGDRCWYAPGTAGNLFGETNSRHYGIDVRVREV